MPSNAFETVAKRIQTASKKEIVFKKAFISVHRMNAFSHKKTAGKSAGGRFN